MKDFLHEKEPFIGADKPGLVAVMLVIIFLAGFGWGAFLWWLFA